MAVQTCLKKSWNYVKLELRALKLSEIDLYLHGARGDLRKRPKYKRLKYKQPKQSNQNTAFEQNAQIINLSKKIVIFVTKNTTQICLNYLYLKICHLITHKAHQNLYQIYFEHYL